MNIETYKSFGLISIVLIWMTIGFMLKSLGPNKAKSISQHAATHKRSFILFGLSLITAIVLFLIFTFRWLIPALELSPLFAIVAWVVATGFLIGAVIPDTTGWKHYTHQWAAWVAAWLMMVLVAIIGFSQHLTLLTRAMTFILLPIMFGLWFWIVIKGRSRVKFLTFQIAYIICFHLVILNVTYLR